MPDYRKMHDYTDLDPMNEPAKAWEARLRSSGQLRHAIARIDELLYYPNGLPRASVLEVEPWFRPHS